MKNENFTMNRLHKLSVFAFMVAVTVLVSCSPTRTTPVTSDAAVFNEIKEGIVGFIID
jgi:hypothetical protein